MIESLEREPFVVSLLFRLTLSEIIVQPIWEGLAQHQWTERQLAELDAHLARIDFSTHCLLALRGERNRFAFPLLESLRKDPRPFLALTASFGSQQTLRHTTLLQFEPSGWVDQNKAALGRDIDKMLNLVDPTSHRFSAEGVERFRDEFNRAWFGGFRPYSFIASLTVSPFQGIPEQCAIVQGTVDLARVAVTLERHRLKHGAYPDSLDLLDPEINPHGIPADDISGKPPHYALTPTGGFTLYYEGWNQTDDGGTIVWRDKEHTQVDSRKGDSVWPQAMAP